MELPVSVESGRMSQGFGSRIVPFSTTLGRHGLDLTRAQVSTLQVNVGLTCNQTCSHCHLEAGPDRIELMGRQTASQVIEFARRVPVNVVDLTGGATELNPLLPEMVQAFAGIATKVIVRSNLTNLTDGSRDDLVSLFTGLGVAIVASFPSANAAQLEAQRGRGALEKSVAALRKLNALGYGQPGSGLTLDLVSNPSGAFLPPCQESMEKKLRVDLQRKWGIVFNNLLTFANVPLGRFRKWLVRSGNFEKYMDKLVSGFNPATLGGLMCRSLISISWEGNVYDCDFNQAAGLPIGGHATHISDLKAPPQPGAPIAVSDHCYACTAGAGFT